MDYGNAYLPAVASRCVRGEIIGFVSSGIIQTLIPIVVAVRSEWLTIVTRWAPLCFPIREFASRRSAVCRQERYRTSNRDSFGESFGVREAFEGLTSTLQCRESTTNSLPPFAMKPESRAGLICFNSPSMRRRLAMNATRKNGWQEAEETTGGEEAYARGWKSQIFIIGSRRNKLTLQTATHCYRRVFRAR